MTSAFGSVLARAATQRRGRRSAGFDVVYSDEYNAPGETNWRPSSRRCSDADVQVLELIGEPGTSSSCSRPWTRGLVPRRDPASANFYDDLTRDGGDIAENLYVRTQFTPFELADENPATPDYLELMERYNPDGKVALLGAQAHVGLPALRPVGDRVRLRADPDCLLEEAGRVTEWTGGGLHAPQSPATTTPRPCFVLLSSTTTASWSTRSPPQPTDGIFNCDDGQRGRRHRRLRSHHAGG